MNVIVKTHSHRARGKLTTLLGFKPQGFYHLTGDTIHNWVVDGYYEIPEGMIEEARKIKGVTILKRRPEGLQRCWSTKR